MLWLIMKNQSGIKRKRAATTRCRSNYLAQENRNDSIDIKSLDRENETRRLMLRTTFTNQHFINELDKVGLQLIKITAGGMFTRGFIVLLEPKSTKMLTE